MRVATSLSFRLLGAMPVTSLKCPRSIPLLQIVSHGTDEMLLFPFRVKIIS